MSTRAASATASLRAKQDLVRILFGSTVPSVAITTTTTKLCALSSPTSRLDHSNYTYNDLRYAYLQRIQQLHPDKHKANQQQLQSHVSNPGPSSKSCSSAPSSSLSDTCQLFVQVQTAWKKYEAFAKMAPPKNKSSWQPPPRTLNQEAGNDPTRNGNNNWSSTQPEDRNGPHDQCHPDSNNSNDDDANFTLFGVGCSFADNDQERQLRIQIMDQAARGWLTCGEIGDIGTTTTTTTTTTAGSHCEGATTSIALSTVVPSSSQQGPLLFTATAAAVNSTTSSLLCGDDLLCDMYSSSSSSVSREKDNLSGTTTKSNTTKLSSLVSHLIPPHRRRI
jgi:hypothetical protein